MKAFRDRGTKEGSSIDLPLFNHFMTSSSRDINGGLWLAVVDHVT